MAQVVVTLDITLDGASLFGRGPLVRRYETDTAVSLRYAPTADANDTSFGDIPGLEAFTTIGLLVVRATDNRVNLRLNGQTDSLIPVLSGGVVLLLDTLGTGATLNNPDEFDPAIVDIVAAGT